MRLGGYLKMLLIGFPDIKNTNCENREHTIRTQLYYREFLHHSIHTALYPVDSL